MGSSDLIKPVIEQRFEGTIHFGRVSMKPGKPTTFASIPVPEQPGAHKFLFALPGNPASALVSFHVFVVPALRKLGGWPTGRCHLPRVKVQVSRVTFSCYDAIDCMCLGSNADTLGFSSRVPSRCCQGYSRGPEGVQYGWSAVEQSREPQRGQCTFRVTDPPGRGSFAIASWRMGRRCYDRGNSNAMM